MKLKLSELNPNPFKKEINKGKLDEDTIKKLRSNMKELGLMGSIPIIKIGNKYHLVSHHHRVEALKREFGKNYEVDVDLKHYSQEQILKGMIIENLTQRNNEYREEESNIKAIEKYLKQNKVLLSKDGKRYVQPSDISHTKPFEEGSSSQISLWLDKGTGEVMKKSKICDLIAVDRDLNPELKEKIHKVGGGKAPEDVVTVKQATQLIRVTKDHKEQKELYEAMKREEKGRPHELLTKYNEASDKIKEKVRKGDLDLKDIPIESFREEIQKKVEEEQKKSNKKVVIVKSKKVMQGIRYESTSANEHIHNFCGIIEKLNDTGYINNLEWKDIATIFDISMKAGEHYAKTAEKMMEVI